MQNFFNIFTAKAYLDARDKTNEPDIIPHHIVKSKGKLKLVAPLTANTDDEVVVSVELTANRSGKIIKRKFKYKDDVSLLAFLAFNEYANVGNKTEYNLHDSQHIPGWHVVNFEAAPWGMNQAYQYITLISPNQWEELEYEGKIQKSNHTVTYFVKGADLDGDTVHEITGEDLVAHHEKGNLQRSLLPCTTF